MHRNDGDSPGPSQSFQGATPPSTPATEVTPEWLTAIQEELCGVIEGEGLTLSAVNNGQLYAALALMISRAGAPAGKVDGFTRSTAPAGWVKANGGTIGSAASGATTRANADTLALFTVLWNDHDNTVLPIQNSSGSATTRGASAAADFAANKRLPVYDLRAEHLRGLDDGRGVDTGRVLGSTQADENKSHTHGILLDGGTSGKAIAGNATGSVINGRALSDGAVGNNPELLLESSGGTEVRVRTVAVLMCIKL
jgi:hypothetical protein